MKREQDHRHVQEKLESACYSLKVGQFGTAKTALNQALEINFEHDAIIKSLKYAGYWDTRQEKLQTIADSFQRAEYLLNEWKAFYRFVIAETPSAGAFNSIKEWLFGQALKGYREAEKEGNSDDFYVLFCLGRCHKGLGDYRQALSFMEAANKKRRQTAAILAELADCCALNNEIKSAKIFFREAFFIGPQKVELEFLESAMIRRLIDIMAQLDLDEGLLKEWLPIHGVLKGVFNVKRELRSLEYGKLRQSILALESELPRLPTEQARQKRPRLLNHYFWLIDYQMAGKEPRTKINEVLEKIKRLDRDIYEQYVS